MDKERSLTWLLPALIIPPLLPLFLGKPTAGEIYLVPMMGFSILALLAGDELSEPLYTRIGLLLGVFGMFIKNDVLLIFPLIVLPWYLAGKFRSKSFSVHGIAGDLGVLLLGMTPVLFWKFDLSSLNIRENFMFGEVEFARLSANLPLLARLFENAIKILLANNYWIGFFLILPAAALYKWFFRQKLSDLFVPLGIFVYLLVMTCIYIFSNTDPFQHMEVSYGRLVIVAVLSTVLYGAKALIDIDKKSMGF